MVLTAELSWDSDVPGLQQRTERDCRPVVGGNVVVDEVDPSLTFAIDD